MDLDLVELENQFKNGNLENCLNSICNHLRGKENSNFYNDVLTEISKLSALKKDFHGNIIPYEIHTQLESKIRATTLGFINKLKFEQEKNRDKKLNNQIETHAFNEVQQLYGVWCCKDSNFDSDTTRVWTLFPNKVGILNIINNTTGGVSAQLSNWNYESSRKIIIEIVNDNEIKGIIEWISPKTFKLTVLTIFKPIMIYEKLL
jgi:hypothetical protein